MIVVIAGFHYLALGIGLGSIFMRGRLIRDLLKKPKNSETFSKLFFADNLWGIAALLWIVTGLARTFGGLEKGSQWYLHSSMFILKMIVFAIIFLLEILPMMTFIRWRMTIKRGNIVNISRLKHIQLHNDVQVVLVCIIPFLAAAMARGIGYALF